MSKQKRARSKTTSGDYEENDLAWMLAACVRKLGGHVFFTEDDSDALSDGAQLQMVSGDISEGKGALLVLATPSTVGHA
ncbi:hypothetical protein UFOVP1339_6 [uncultured Caudovirales phage]|uniref:Uncharacterized protein n=1 Tax=uncultured Caudovirales phage TaxID=2100421 RepID=A0A6J5S2K3_9CAUD|nr:hypothetical protein UFOVP1339_6 [uncultured Caudovirales phage]